MDRSARIFLSLGLALAALTSVNHQPLVAQSGPVTLALATATEGEPMTEASRTPRWSPAATFPSTGPVTARWTEEGDFLSNTLREIERGERFSSATVAVAQTRNRSGLPWIIAGSALVVGGAIVGDDVGTLLMAGGVVGVAYGMYIYF